MLGRFAQTQSTQDLLERVKLAATQAAVVFWLAGLFHEYVITPESWVVDSTAQMMHWIALLLVGTPIVVSAVRGLSEGHAHVDELVAIAIVGCIGANFVLDIPLIEDAAGVAVIMTLGALVEEWASSSAHRSIKSLESLVPTTVRVVRSGGEIREVDADDVKVGDVLLVRPGDRVGADGEIIEGETSLNQAAITGESLPVERGPGDDVFAGSINLSGAVKVKVEHVRGDSALGRIIRMIRQGEAFQPHIVRTADKFFQYYTPAILLFAVFVGWFAWGPDAASRKDAFSRAVAVLVVGCPCPLILASPIAILCGLSRAARSGIAIKAGAFLEAINDVRIVVFDKTGTLTTGQIKVVSVDPAAGVSVDEVVRAAAVAEVRSNHPLAQAVLREAKVRGITPGEPATFSQVGGLGVMAEHQGKKILVGSRKLMEKDIGVEMFAEQRKAIDVPSDDARLHVFVLIDGKLAGVIRMEDTVREDAASVITQLRAMGVDRFCLITGDRVEVGRRVAQPMGITEVHGDLLPEEKIRFIHDLQARGHKVAMVGDGVNDAPALVAADVGIAVGDTATEVALEAANAAILSGSLKPIPFFFSISRRTVKVINRNLLIASLFNVAALLVVAFGQLSPVGATVIHVLATLVVVLNSLQLNKHEVDTAVAPATAATPAPVSV